MKTNRAEKCNISVFYFSVLEMDFLRMPKLQLHILQGAATPLAILYTSSFGQNAGEIPILSHSKKNSPGFNMSQYWVSWLGISSQI